MDEVDTGLRLYGLMDSCRPQELMVGEHSLYRRATTNVQRGKLICKSHISRQESQGWNTSPWLPAPDSNVSSVHLLYLYKFGPWEKKLLTVWEGQRLYAYGRCLCEIQGQRHSRQSCEFSRKESREQRHSKHSEHTNPGRHWHIQIPLILGNVPRSYHKSQSSENGAPECT